MMDYKGQDYHFFFLNMYLGVYSPTVYLPKNLSRALWLVSSLLLEI